MINDVPEEFKKQCKIADMCLNFPDVCWRCHRQSKLKLAKRSKHYKRSKRKGHKLELDTLNANSGNSRTASYRNDVKRGIFSIECKQTGKKQITIKQETLNKAEIAAIAQDKIPLVNFRFANGPIYSIIDYETLLSLVEDSAVLDDIDNLNAHMEPKSKSAHVLRKLEKG